MTKDVTAREDVLRRIREGRGQDWRLDIAIADLLGQESVPDYTASVDPWLALAREKWPGIEIEIAVNDGGAFCHINDGGTLCWEGGVSEVEAQHPTDPARACALAYLTALEDDQ